MSPIKRFERKFLFPLTRSFALILIFILLLGIAATTLIITGIGVPTTRVTPTEVIHPSPENNEATNQADNSSLNFHNDSLLGKKLPFQIQKYFDTPRNLEILRGWLNAVSSEEQQGFLDELADTITAAEESGMDVMAAVNKYKEIKLFRLAKAALAKEELKQNRIYYIGAISGGITLIALFSLTLVLLSIERNTRPHSDE